MKNILEIIKEKYTLSQTMSSVEDIVQPIFMRLSLDKVVNKSNLVDEEYRTDWTKLLMDIDKSRGILTTLIQSLFGAYGGSVTGLYDLNMTTARRQVTMIFANTKDKKQQSKLVKLIQDALGNKYLVVKINGDETNNRESEKMVKCYIEKSKIEGKKVVFVSKDMASRSFSVSEIDTVMLMFDRGSFASTAQKISRVLTPGNTFYGDKKIFGCIISLSLDPNRENVNPIDKYIIYEAEKVDVDDLYDGIKRVLRSIQVFTNGDGGEVEIEKDEYVDNLINSTSLVKLGAESSKVENIINDLDLVKILTGIEIHEGKKEKLLGVDSSKVKRTQDNNNMVQENNKTQNNKEDIRKKLKEVLKNIFEKAIGITEINNCESDDIIEILEMIISKGYCGEVEFEVGVDCETVKKVILMRGVSRKLLNTIISSYNHQSFLLY
jgi:hypothetical protein